MQKQIIRGTGKNTFSYEEGTDLALMTNNNKITKRVLSLLLKRYTLLIELKDKTLISATYKDTKIIGRTTTDILLVYDELTREEVEIDIADIRIIRVYR